LPTDIPGPGWRGRREASAAIRQKVVDLTSGAPTPLGKMQALAAFVQNDIRYVAIELGIGGGEGFRCIRDCAAGGIRGG
jgi:hypothetical protein